MKIKQLYPLLFAGLLFLTAIPATTAQHQSGTIRPDIGSYRQFNPWEQSINPAGIQLTEVDSLMEITIGHNNLRPAFCATDQPDRLLSYRGTVDGYKRLGALQLSGGLGWQQYRLKGQSWNFLEQPGYLITAGDSLANPRHSEQYSLYGKAAYVLSPRLLAGLAMSYTATANKDASPEKRYSGSAHTAVLSAGLVRSGRQGRIGLSAGYTHRTELLTYGSTYKERLYTYPLGYFIPMQEINDGNTGILRSSAGNSNIFRSIGNEWQAAGQAEWLQPGWSWFNELYASFERRRLSPNDSENMHGWKEQYLTLGYRSRLSIGHGRWTHLVSPALLLKRTLSDRILQRPDPNNFNGAWVRFGLLRFASRHTADLSVSYCLARDYTPDGATQAWQLAIGWSGNREEIYSYPFTIAQLTGTIHAEAAFVCRMPLPHTAGLMLRPSVTLLTGNGTEERITREENNAAVEIKAYRNYGRVSSTFAALTTTRLGFGLQAEYRRPLAGSVDGGLRLQAYLERIAKNQTDYQLDKTGGGGMLALIVWL